MQPVDIRSLPDSSVILQARGSELLIIAEHVLELQGLKKPQDFAAYFMEEALVNRPARKLYEAWLRKDRSLWQRLYKLVGEVEITAERKKELLETLEEIQDTEPKAKEKPVEKKAAPKKKAEEKKASPKKEKAEEKKKTAKKTTAKKATAKKATKKKTEKKPAAKKTTKKASKTAKKKPAVKKTTAKKKTTKKKK